METRIEGVVAATAAPLFVTVGFMFWEQGYVQGSAFFLNLFKACLASPLLLLAAAVDFWIRGTGTFLAASAADVLWLVFSALIGIVIGDLCWIRAMQLIGARAVVLVDSMKPFLAAVLAAIHLGEDISAFIVLGMVLTSVGVVGASLDPKSSSKVSVEPQEVELEAADEIAEEKEEAAVPMESGFKKAQRDRIIGLAFSALNVFFDVYGSIITKLYAGSLNAWDISFIRFASSAAILMSVFLCVSLIHPSAFLAPPKSLTNRQWCLVSVGVVFATFIASFLFNFALLRADVSVVSVLSSLSPIYAVAYSVIFRRQPASPRVWIFTVLACSGVVILYIF
jgi:drug/metabolite transporter (DMT)-like permease